MDFQVKSWEGRFHKKGLVIIALKQPDLEEECLFLQRLCQCKLTLEMTEKGGQQASSKVELLCLTKDLLEHLQSTTSTVVDTCTPYISKVTSEPSDIEERIAQCLKEIIAKKVSTEEKKMIEAPETATEVVAPEISSIFAILCTLLGLLVTFVCDLVVSGCQLAVNVVRQLFSLIMSKKENDDLNKID